MDYFEVTFANQSRVVYPLDVIKLAIVTDDRFADGFIFQRKMLSGALVFSNNNGSDDYAWFNTIETTDDYKCQEIIITWWKMCEGSYQEFWKGIFSTGNGEFDKDRCIFKVKPQPYDRYYCLLNNWELQSNFLEMTNVITTTGINNNNLEFHTCRFDYLDYPANGIITNIKRFFLEAEVKKRCFDEVSYPETWKVLHIEVIPPLAPLNAKVVCIIFREKIVSNCVNGNPSYPQGSSWVLIQDDCATNNQAIFARQPTFDVWDNPDTPIKVLMGDCGISLPTSANIPPAPVYLPVYFDNQPGTYIWGCRNVSLVADGTEFYYEVFLNDDVTYLWSIQASVGATIISGQGTNRIRVEFPSAFATGVITCEITPSSGFPKQITMNLTSGSNLLAAPRMRYNPEMCDSGKDYDCELPEVVGATYTWTVSSGLTINSGSGTNKINIEGTGVVGFESISCDIDLGNGTVITVSNITYCTDTPETGSILGMTSAHLNDECHYKVPLANSTYTWNASNGSVVSSSANTAVIEWDALQKNVNGRVIVKETANCGCSYYMIADCGTELNDYPFYWCNKLDTLEFDRNRLLMEVIEFCLSKMDCEQLEVVSDFFEYNAPADTPGYVAGVNYVTGFINQVDFLTICAKSDIAIHGINTQFSSNAASASNITFKRIMEFLKDLFNVYWIVDNNGKVRIEHLSWFKNTMSLDLSTVTIETQAQNKYKHLTDEIPKFERWNIADSLNVDFVGAEIRYSGLCVNSETEDRHEVSDVSTDLNYILGTNESISLDGYVIIANAYDGDYEIIKDTGVISGVEILNAPLALANLHDAFHKHGRKLSAGNMNNADVIFVAYRPTIEQVFIEIPMCCEYLTFNTDGYVLTELGVDKLGGVNGYVKKSEFSLSKETLKLTINYSY